MVGSRRNDEGNSVNQMIGPDLFIRTKAGIAANAPDIYSGGWAFNPVTTKIFIIL